MTVLKAIDASPAARALRRETECAASARRGFSENAFDGIEVHAVGIDPKFQPPGRNRFINDEFDGDK